MTTITPTFMKVYGFSHTAVGFAYVGLGIGYTIGCITFSLLSDWILKRMTAQEGDGDMKPEYRLPLLIFGGIVAPTGFLWFGWSVGRAHWIVPIVGLGFSGFGGAIIIVSSRLLLLSRWRTDFSRLRCRYSLILWTPLRFSRRQHSQ